MRDNSNTLNINNIIKKNSSKPELLPEADLTHSKTASISQFLSNDLSLSLTPSVDPKSVGVDKDHQSRSGAHDSIGNWKQKPSQTFFSGGFKNRFDASKKKIT